MKYFSAPILLLATFAMGAYCAAIEKRTPGVSEALYLVSAYYDPGSEGGVRWNDPRFSVAWL
jgi:dTDP-4-dehydrorhamnose 3,5-epimerase-like enzyme